MSVTGDSAHRAGICQRSIDMSTKHKQSRAISSHGSIAYGTDPVKVGRMELQLC